VSSWGKKLPERECISQFTQEFCEFIFVVICGKWMRLHNRREENCYGGDDVN